MGHYTPDFTLKVNEITGVCSAGEAYAQKCMAEKKTPVFSCEGPCIRGEIARLAANMVANEIPSFARACHAETFFVPHSSMLRWVKDAEKAIMIDGCFLTCHGRVLKNLIGEAKSHRSTLFPSTRNTSTSSRWRTFQRRSGKRWHDRWPTRLGPC